MLITPFCLTDKLKVDSNQNLATDIEFSPFYLLKLNWKDDVYQHDRREFQI